MSTTDWFTVDRAGLAALLDRSGRHRVVLEAISNAFDEDGVTDVRVVLVPSSTRGIAMFAVSDDSPTGFTRLSDAWTMFAPSKKKGNVEQRGRFNLGEKLFLSVCKRAEIHTTTGTVTFDDVGRKSTTRSKREVGSAIEADLRFTRADIDAALGLIRQVIIPDHITLTVNDEPMPHRVPVREFEVSLPTEFEDADGQWHSTTRVTTVRLYTPVGAAVPQIFEMGIPVVEDADQTYDVDVSQKVPLNSDRDNVTPSYLRKLRTAVLNATADLLDAESANSTWVNDALEHASPEAIERVLDQRYGPRRVIADPSDPEGTKLAVSKGYAVIHGGALNRGTWARVREHGIVLPAGKVTPSPKVLTSPDGVPPIPVEEWTEPMHRVARFAQTVAEEALGFRVTVAVFRMPMGTPWAAAYGDRRLSFNLTALGHKFFDDPRRVMEILIHEFGHEYAMDHLSSAYHDALCRIGAAIWQHAADLPFPQEVSA